MAIAEEEVKAATTKESGKTKKAKKKKAKAKKKPSSQKTTEQQVASRTKKQKPLADTTSALPDTLSQQRIVCQEVGNTTPTNITLDEINGTSMSIYVDDIHHANPSVLQTIYWIHLKNHRYVIARVSEKQYEIICQNKPRITHLVSVVDCAVTPTLSYGSWKRHELKNDFPSAQQISAKDEAFQENGTNFHNPPVKIELLDVETDNDSDDSSDEEWDFSDEDEEAFDFSDD